MHDIDRVQLESDAEFEQWESSPTDFGQAEAEPFEYEAFELDEGESPLYGEAESVFEEADEMELAGELLGAGTEPELDQFLNKLIKRACQAVGRTLRSAGRQAIGGLLKGAARRALPGIGSVIGGHPGGAAIGRLGAQSLSAAGRAFGLELEGLSGEDQEFEVARRFVRFGGDAVRNLAHTPSGGDLLSAARAATIGAVQKHAPGLLQQRAPATSPASTPHMAGGAQSGRWKRRGNKIVLYGL